jgi:hypothetical protein
MTGTTHTTSAAGAVLGASAGTPASGKAAGGGVLGAQATVATAKAPAKHAARGGVLGTVARAANGNLPFTGFPIWAAVLVAAALVAAGVLARRWAGGTSRS